MSSTCGMTLYGTERSRPSHGCRRGDPYNLAGRHPCRTTSSANPCDPPDWSLVTRRADPRGVGTRATESYTDPEQCSRTVSGVLDYAAATVRTSGPGLIALHKGYALPLLAVIVWIALVVWLGLVVWSLSVVRAAAGADAPAPAAGTPAPRAACRSPAARRAMAIGQALAARRRARRRRATSATRASGSRSPLVGLIALLVLGSDILVLDAKRFRIGGSFTGLVLAMALLGPAPAALLGLASALVDALRRARARHLPAQQPR